MSGMPWLGLNTEGRQIRAHWAEILSPESNFQQNAYIHGASPVLIMHNGPSEARPTSAIHTVNLPAQHEPRSLSGPGISVAIPAGSFLQVVLQYQSTGGTIRGTPATRGQDGVTKIPEFPYETRMLIRRDGDRGSQGFMVGDLCDDTWVHQLTVTNSPQLLLTRPLDLPPEARRLKEAELYIPGQSERSHVQYLECRPSVAFGVAVKGG
ncbi:hypothetical protein FBULB1_2162 [Fusarium bulbicola]|nr:hypothetical protein FBULB1_2162 [Fusarium bulbicola]